MPVQTVDGIKGLVDWNRLEGWKRHYEDTIPIEIVFFATDTFSGQFGVSKDSVVRLEPESGTLANHSCSMEDWAAKLLAKYNYETGWSVAKSWQEING